MNQLFESTEYNQQDVKQAQDNVVVFVVGGFNDSNGSLK